ncbi:MAG: solute carrier family 23 protein [Oscillospiraceae bacterium]|nr:solute carrier family 23 protein [Oscillospiraceae bacterium]
MKLYYDVKDKPKFPQLVVYAVQQLLAIMAATLVVPIIVGNGMQPSAALFGAGIGTLVYVLFTKAKSPVFLGSSFAFIGSMCAAFAGAVSAQAGYAGLIIGAAFAALVYVVIALVVKFVGVGWIDKIMPKQVIGPTVAIIGLSLAGNAIGDLQKGDVMREVLVDGKAVSEIAANPLIAVLCGIVALAVTMLCSTYGKKSIKLIPFIVGILSGYALAAIFTVIGIKTGNDSLQIIDFSVFSSMSVFELPDFTIRTAIKGIKEIDGAYIGSVAVAYLPVALVVFAEHIADHKNISSIIEKDLLKDPGLDRTLAGDGIGSFVGAIFGGCPNTTYGESVACVAITRNASVYTIITAACGAMLISFFSPFVAFVDSIPACVMGGVCMALYGFIAVSGLKMIQSVDLEDNKNLFTVSVILIAGIGGLTLSFGKITITAVACALILGILTNLMLSKGKKDSAEADSAEAK